jgi:2-desacetyl-2-hydroxyethyl bacteriochlorophyllide A dehydrogenase
MRAVAFERPGSVAIVDRPEPELLASDDAVVRIEAAGICGSDLHIYRGRVPTQPGFTLGHEYVGTVVAAGDAVSRVRVGDRVLGTFMAVCGACGACRRGEFSLCGGIRLFGLGPLGGCLQGTQAELALVPHANLTLRRVPPGLPDATALLAGDVMATGYHAVLAAGLVAGETCAVVGAGAVGLCAVMCAHLAGAAAVFAIDSVEPRLEIARSLGAVAVHHGEHDCRRAVGAHTSGRGADVAIEAVGSPDALRTACRVVRKGGTVSIVGVHAEPAAVAMDDVFIRGLRIVAGLANVVAHVDRVLALMAAGRLQAGPLAADEVPLAQAPEAYARFDRRETAKILLRP